MALEDGGITRQDIDGTQTGVYIGKKVWSSMLHIEALIEGQTFK
jgi:acyl transferase domain-containing protein